MRPPPVILRPGLRIKLGLTANPLVGRGTSPTMLGIADSPCQACWQGQVAQILDLKKQGTAEKIHPKELREIIRVPEIRWGGICAGENTQAGKVAGLCSLKWRGDWTALRPSGRRSHAARTKNAPGPSAPLSLWRGGAYSTAQEKETAIRFGLVLSGPIPRFDCR